MNMNVFVKPNDQSEALGQTDIVFSEGFCDNMAKKLYLCMRKRASLLTLGHSSQLDGPCLTADLQRENVKRYDYGSNDITKSGGSD